ncbi:SRSO17 transposase [Bradyrhizobium sp. JR3.5]
MARGGRKSVEPMAAVTAPERTATQHPSLLHFVGSAAWSDEETPDELPGRYSPPPQIL